MSSFASGVASHKSLPPGIKGSREGIGAPWVVLWQLSDVLGLGLPKRHGKKTKRLSIGYNGEVHRFHRENKNIHTF